MNELSIGQKAKITKTFSEQDIFKFADLVKDHNPIHIDKEFAKNSIFGKRIVHGMFISSLISAVLGTKLPGPGSIYLNQSLQFLAPVFIGDTITAIVEVINIRNDKPIINVNTICVNQTGNVVLEGEAVLKV